MRDSHHFLTFLCDRSLMKCVLRTRLHTSLRTRLCEAVAYVFWCKLDLQDIINEVDRCPRFAEDLLFERMRKSPLGSEGGCEVKHEAGASMLSPSSEGGREVKYEAGDVSDNTVRNIAQSLWVSKGFMGFDLNDETTLREQWAGKGFYRSLQHRGQ